MPVVCLLCASLSQDSSGTQCLLIDRVVKSDAGWYTVSAINEAGMSTSNARLDVGCKWILHFFLY